MRIIRPFILLLVIASLLLSCAPKRTSEQTSAEQPSMDGVCGYLTKTEIELALGEDLVEDPVEINEEYLGGRGCSYSGKKVGGEAHFGYVTFPSAEEFDKVRNGKKREGVGDEAYNVSGPDAQQLWVRKGELYVMVAIGDVPQPEASKKLAELILQRLKTKPLEMN